MSLVRPIWLYWDTQIKTNLVPYLDENAGWMNWSSLSIHCEINQPANPFYISVSACKIDLCSLWNKHTNVSLIGSVTIKSHCLGVKNLKLLLVCLEILPSLSTWCNTEKARRSFSLRTQMFLYMFLGSGSLHPESVQKQESIVTFTDWAQERRPHWTFVNAADNVCVQKNILTYQRSACITAVVHICFSSNMPLVLSEKCHLLQKDRKPPCILNDVCSEEMETYRDNIKLAL